MLFDDQHHPLTLVKPYSSDVPLENQEDCKIITGTSENQEDCKICNDDLTKENWLYYCALCHYQTHVRCSISRSKPVR
ncbi:unnamed protein product [Ilex paraguariensis]|uniref:DC1 domain-containing protein n=1 Tax=Ilex paraguariensis TaxID=185542 RepID=A0ABC8SQ46_9AQUA